jgi:hypothetical protein
MGLLHSAGLSGLHPSKAALPHDPAPHQGLDLEIERVLLAPD